MWKYHRYVPHPTIHTAPNIIRKWICVKQFILHTKFNADIGIFVSLVIFYTTTHWFSNTFSLIYNHLSRPVLWYDDWYAWDTSISDNKTSTCYIWNWKQYPPPSKGLHGGFHTVRTSGRETGIIYNKEVVIITVTIQNITLFGSDRIPKHVVFKKTSQK